MRKDLTWLNVKNTMLVRKMKKPDDCTNKQWSTIKHVLDTMAGFSDENGDKIYPSYKLIAEYTGLSERSVYECIAFLLKAKILKKKKHYCLNLQLIESMIDEEVTAQGAVVDELSEHSAVITAQGAVNETDLLNTAQSLLNTAQYNKELTTSTLKKQATNARARDASAFIKSRLISFGISSELSDSLLEQFELNHIGSNLDYFEVRRKIQRIDNPAAWLCKAIRENYAHVKPPHADTPTPPLVAAPTLDELRAYWDGLPADKKQAEYDAAIKQVPSIGYLVQGAVPPLDILTERFKAHVAFKDLCLYQLSNSYLKSLGAQNLKDLGHPDAAPSPPIGEIRKNDPKTILEIISELVSEEN